MCLARDTGRRERGDMNKQHFKEAALENARMFGIMFAWLAALAAVAGLCWLIFGGTATAAIAFAAIILLATFSVTTYMSYRQRVKQEERDRQREERLRESG